MHVFVIITAILFSLGAIHSLFELKLLHLVAYAALAIMGWSLINSGYVNPNTYLGWVLGYSIVSLIWNLLKGTIELVSLTLCIISACLLLS